MIPPARIAAACAVLALMPCARSAASAELDQRVHQLFQERCADCHGLHQTKFSNHKNPQLDADTDLIALRGNRDFVGDGVANSALYDLVTADDEGRMPKSTAEDPRPPLTAEEKALIKDWIEQGATNRPFISDKSVLEAIAHDLEAAAAPDRPFYRYLTLHNLSNAGDPDTQLEIYRAALGKLVNSLSWQSAISRPTPIDPAHLVFRVDLRQYGWDAAKWDLLVRGYPYAIILNLQLERKIATMAGTPLAYLRGDWFVFAASQPPLYELLLGLPASDRELEAAFHLPVLDNVKRGVAKRAGFSRSGVSDFNRVVERHPVREGAYWKSYDFKSNDGEQDIVRHPLGPAALGGAHAFRQDGGEIIWSLPNGLQAYLLASADGTRLARAPTEIVHDRDRHDSAIINGISCIKCHAEGMRALPDDELRADALKYLDLTPAEQELLKALYPVSLRAEYEQDVQRFQAALALAGAPATVPEPVSFLYERFRRNITLVSFASEFGVSATDLHERLADSDDEALRSFGSRLRHDGFPRKGFIEQFRKIVEGLQLGRLREFEVVRHEEFFPTKPGVAAATASNVASAPAPAPVQYAPAPRPVTPPAPTWTSRVKAALAGKTFAPGGSVYGKAHDPRITFDGQLNPTISFTTRENRGYSYEYQYTGNISYNEQNETFELNWTDYHSTYFNPDGNELTSHDRALRLVPGTTVRINLESLTLQTGPTESMGGVFEELRFTANLTWRPQ